ncbi:methyltransferase domain-containing protein [Sphingomonas quercus]|uniref:Methyltransferase domain-containing protein n=1 Tax=Sphingomonas quercus TaxID=2842451 RepID=A0ABS6BFA7_9SPHN|nr:methyltransferase domain-containing protein [Sphingomonas quercus]MBU3076982.1 methyltransferase domain-containing protein [Sphingomonas quercus]
MRTPPPAFDPATYRARNPALAALSDEAARAHYEAEGRAAGLVASPFAVREGLLGWIAAAPSVLEIGPFCRPLLTGAHVDYLDVLDADALRARARKLGMDPAGCPEVIQHVGELAQVDRRYAAVVSSHAIEHQPDLVAHLREVERVLEPDGVFCLLIPDKRYCFDHFLPESSIAGVLQAYREGRRRHILASVIEHAALTAHNDPERHWAGDHGAPAEMPARRVADAIRRHDEAGGGYLDVHAWQFTPQSFRAIIDTLQALGLIGLEVAGVYDTARGRNEFVAILRPDRQAAQRLRAAAEHIRVIALQTADADRYAAMLAITQPNVAEYCRRHGYGYEAYIGIKRGFHPWQASYNRIAMLSELVARGYDGWVLYMDADAWVADLDFDLAAYLARHRDRAAIIATAGVTPARWDVNDGVMLINLGHPTGRALVARWQALFDERLPDARLREAVEWVGEDNDQDLLQRLLREDSTLADAVLVESMAVLNGPAARFVRQHLRAHTADFRERMRALAEAVADSFRLGEAAPPIPTTAADQRWRWRLARPIGHEPALAEAPLPAPRPALAERAIEAWRAGGGKPRNSRPHEAALAEALDRGDAEAVAAMLAGLGRDAAGQGLLGGAQQHGRARDPVFAYRLALIAQDRMVSLAEAVGALPLEDPEDGPWGVNAALAPPALWAMIAGAIGADITPPDQIGGHLGLATGGAIVHLRMIEGLHAAWRLRQLGSSRVIEIGGAAGLAAAYAARLGLGHVTVDGPLRRAIQAYVAGGRTAGTLTEAGPADTLLVNEATGALTQALLADAREAGIVRALIIDGDAGLAGIAGRMTDAGWRLISRNRHWLRPGAIESVWEPGRRL